MAYLWQRDLADVLRAALPAGYVIEEPDWQSRGRPDGTFEPGKLMLHHDASPPGQTSSGVDVIRDGRPGLDGPLGQLWLRADGIWHVVAAGRANHAGEGQWPGIPRDQGNSYAIGIETDHTTNEQWYRAQALSGVLGIRALAERYGILGSAAQLHDGFMAHKEYAPGRKIDPDPLDMDELRAFILNPPPLQESFMDRIEKSSSVAQEIPAGKWTTLRLSASDDPTGVYGIAPGPFRFLVDVHLVTVHGQPGDQLLVRAVNTAGDADNVTSPHPPAETRLSDPDAQHVNLSMQGATDEGEWLRIQLRPQRDVSVTQIQTRATLW